MTPRRPDTDFMRLMAGYLGSKGFTGEMGDIIEWADWIDTVPVVSTIPCPGCQYDGFKPRRLDEPCGTCDGAKTVPASS